MDPGEVDAPETACQQWHNFGFTYTMFQIFTGKNAFRKHDASGCFELKWVFQQAA